MVGDAANLPERREEFRAAESGWVRWTELITGGHEEQPHLPEEWKLGRAWRIEVARPVARSGRHGSRPHRVEAIATRQFGDLRSDRSADALPGGEGTRRPFRSG